MDNNKVKSVKLESEKDNKPLCFIIMPFGEWFDKYYFEIYVPAIEAAGLEAKRADDLYRPGNIVNDIWNLTKDASVILADLTNKNANVFYELGLSHAITKPAVLITASLDDIPFDLRSLRVIEYDKNYPNWGEILKDNIKKALNETMKNPKDAIPPTFLDVVKEGKIKVSQEGKEILELRKDFDSLRRELRPLKTSREKIPRIEGIIDPHEAELLIKFYLENDFDPIYIAEKLRELGPPIQWTMEKIKQLKRNNNSKRN